MNPSGYVADNSEEQESNISSEISDDDSDESKRSDSGLSSDDDTSTTILPKLKLTMSPAKSIFHRKAVEKHIFREKIALFTL